MTKSAWKIVCDAGPIIHLDELNSLYLLEDFKQILISETIDKEIRQYRPSAFKKLRDLTVLSSGNIPTNDLLLTLCQNFMLNTGEIEARELMEKYPEAIFLTDDASARLVATQMGFKIHGTIGVLIRSIRRGQMRIEEVLNILKELPLKSTLYIKPSLLEEITFKIKEEFKLL